MNKSKPTVLIVDDMLMNRMLLIDILDDEYNILEASNGIEAIDVFEKNKDSIAVILLDAMMPELDGFGFLEVMSKRGSLENIPVVMISAEDSPEYIAKGYDLGVADYINRPFDPNIVIRRVKNIIMLYAKQQVLTNLIKEQISEREENNSILIDILSSVVEFRNGESGPHVLHVRRLTELLLKELAKIDSKYSMSLPEISLWATASAMHDIGKIAIDDKILNKPGRFTDEEYNIMKNHSMFGYEILDGLSWRKDVPLIDAAKQICRWHHERWDGHGYPDGLKGDEIPVPAQVVALADVYDALTSERVYKPAYSHEKALNMITNGECGEFNPDLLKALLQIGDIIKEKINNPDDDNYEILTEKIFEDLQNRINQNRE